MSTNMVVMTSLANKEIEYTKYENPKNRVPNGMGGAREPKFHHFRAWHPDPIIYSPVLKMFATGPGALASGF